MSDLQTSFIGPLIDALGYRGPNHVINYAIPENRDQLGKKDIKIILANLKYASSTYYDCGVNKMEKFPLLAETHDRKLQIIVSKLEGETYLYFDQTTMQYKQGNLETTYKELTYFEFQTEFTANIMDTTTSWFTKFIGRFTKPLIKTCFLSLFINLLSLTTPFFIMLVYNQIAIHGVETNFSILFFGIALIVTLQSICSLLREHTFNYLSARTSYLVSNELMRRSLYFPLLFSDQSSVGDHISRFKNFQRVREFFNQHMLVTIMDIPYTIMTILAIYLVAGEVAYIPITAIFVYLCFSLYFSPILSKMGDHSMKLSKLKNQFIFESIMGLRNFTTPKIKQRLNARFDQINQETIRSKLAIKRKDQFLNILSSTIISLTAFATIGFTVSAVVEGEVNPGALMAVILLIWKTLAPINSFFNLIGQFHFYRNTVSSIDKYMEIDLEERPEDYFKEEKEIRGTIEFKGVSIRFIKESFPSLINVDLKIPSNHTILMLGKNGSGKSTILKMIIALYDPQAGRIAIDGINIKQLNPLKLRTAIHYCDCSNAFFKDTILNNFKIVNDLVTEEQIREVLKKLGAQSKLENLPYGLDSIIDTEDDKHFPHQFLVSLALARAYLSTSKVLLFDDLSAGLNQEELVPVKELLIELKNKRTIIITDQDAHLIDISDRIVLLEKGKVQYSGKAEEANALFKAANK